MYKRQVYTDIQEMLVDPEIDAVIILTSSGTHGTLGILAAEAGKHVIVEKPIDISVEKAKELIDACERNHVLLSCIFQHRYDKDTNCLLYTSSCE